MEVKNCFQYIKQTEEKELVSLNYITVGVVDSKVKFFVVYFLLFLS